MRIICRYKNKEWVENIESAQIIIGRQQSGQKNELNLDPDVLISRRHARLWLDAGVYWIEDLNSAGGTRLNGTEIRGQGRQEINHSTLIEIGETTLRVPGTMEQTLAASPSTSESSLPPLNIPPQSLDARNPDFLYSKADATETERRLSFFYHLPLKFGAETNVNSLLQLIVESAVDAIPGAQRGAILIEDVATGQLALRAHSPIGHVAASTTLARQAISQLKALMWPPVTAAKSETDVQETTTESMVEYKIEATMYAPLLWGGKPLGALCVDRGDSTDTFDEEDLRLLQAIAYHGAMTLTNLQLQEEQHQQAEVQNRFLKLVSPQIAERLMQYRGRLKLGGEFRNVTILFSDIRGFTNMSQTMSPDEVTDMLEDYYDQLVPIVFKNQGIIDKFVGDAILAVFGSPYDDKQQQFHAVLTAMEMQTAISQVNLMRSAQGKRTGQLGIGIHCGEVIHGLIGAAERMEFTVIGDTVNRASRICDGARGGEILISMDVYPLIWQAIDVEETQVATKHEGNLRAFRVKRIKQGQP